MVFSIAAINDTDSQSQWEPLAPTKEAQEFHLSQTYHDGLVKLQAKEYKKAQELLEAVLNDSLLLETQQVDSSGSDGHLLQLRFLALKNLATVFLEQGCDLYESALRCYLEAVEIDTKDSVVWNKLGTLACSMGLLSISRWAFEQGLICSPNNWNCMEKLLEVLIAIGDEMACLSVADLILRRWPSHSRALHVKGAIEESEPIPFAPRGIDKLEPKHVRLKFSDKRKANDDVDVEVSTKKLCQVVEVKLKEATWVAVAGILLDSLLVQSRSDSKILTSSSSKQGDIRLCIDLQSCTDESNMFAKGKNVAINKTGEEFLQQNAPSNLMTISKEKDSASQEEQPHERRSSRIERLRTRKPDKEQELSDNPNGKDLSNVACYLEPYIVGGCGVENTCIDSLPAVDTSVSEYSSVINFIRKTSINHGAFHMGHMLLDEVSSRQLLWCEELVKFLELEQLTRQWGEERTPQCSLFLAELYHDIAMSRNDLSNPSEYMIESSYHLCKIIESVASGFSDSAASQFTHGIESQHKQNCPKEFTDGESRIGCSLSTIEMPFWVRFYWLSGQLSIFDGDKERALEELFKSLSLLVKLEMEGVTKSVHVPHCKIFCHLTVHIILHQINLLKVDSLLKGTSSSLIEKEMYVECVDLLAPLLLSSKTLDLPIRVAGKDGVAFDEISALDVLIQACGKTLPLNLEVYLNCHCRKLRLLGEAAGMQLSLGLFRNSTTDVDTRSLHHDKDPKENTNKHWLHLVTEEVKAISQSVSLIKQCVDSSDGPGSMVMPVHSIADMQSSILAVMCNIAVMLCSRLTVATTDEPEHEQVCCFVDAAISFFKLQHLHSSVPIKTQVDLIVAVHDLLAEYGICCANGYKGEEGLFLKLAIKHLLVLDMKLKSCSSGPNIDVSQCEKLLSPHNFNGCHNEANMEVMKIKHCAQGDQTEVMEADKLHKITCPEVPSHGLTKSHSRTEVEKLISGNLNENPDAGQHSPDTLIRRGDGFSDDEIEDLETAIDNALNQCFFCLYGLNLRSDSSYEDDLAMHKNTTRGDYQSKEQCADVFKYILPYAKASSKTGLIKLRRVLRAIRKHFPEPPEDAVNKHAIDKFLDDLSINEDKLSEEAGSTEFLETMLKVIFPDSVSNQLVKTSSMGSCEPYLDVYCNLYYLLAQSEDMSATDKWPGFLLTKEGEEFIEQNAKLYKYDLLYNPLHFESWKRLAHIYDEEVDLLLNDGSKHINVSAWRKSATLPQRVETSRRRSRRCLLMSLALAQRSTEQGEIHELLALVYYDSLQNVVPSYDQRCVTPAKDATWRNYCEKSLKHFKKASGHDQDWTHAFYMGKLSEKLGHQHETAFAYYNKAITLNPSAVDSFYRMHASRLKLLAESGKQNMGSLKVVAEYCCNQETKDAVLNIFGKLNSQTSQVPLDMNVEVTEANLEESKCEDSRLLEEAWHLLYHDCLSALNCCVEGDLKHFHKARYMLALGLYLRGENGDLEKAKDELSFCFKSSRSSFTINMWEIDAAVKKGRRKTPGCPGGHKRVLEVNLPESSRKFITCMRKYLLFYLRLLEETKDISLLDRAFVSLRADKRFALSLEDLVPFALGRYVKALIPSIQHTLATDSPSLSNSENLLEKLFNLFVEQVALWPDMCSLPDFKSLEWSGNNIFQYLYQYIHSLEVNMKLEALENIVEKIRKRFKNPKLSNSNCAKVCRHASDALCRCLIISLALVTPGQPEASVEVHENKPSDGAIENSQVLWIDLRTDELWSSSIENQADLKILENKWTPKLSSIRNIRVRKVSDKDVSSINLLLRVAFNFFRDTSSVMVPSGVKMYSIPSRFAVDMQMKPEIDRIEIRDLSIQKKLLIWAYTLLHGQYTSIGSIIRYCEENIKVKVKKGSSISSTPSSSSTTPPTPLPASGGSSMAEHQATYAPAESTPSPSITAAATSRSVPENNPQPEQTLF